MPLFGPPNIEKLKEKGDVRRLCKALSHKDPVIREGAVAAFGDQGVLSKLAEQAGRQGAAIAQIEVTQGPSLLNLFQATGGKKISGLFRMFLEGVTEPSMRREAAFALIDVLRKEVAVRRSPEAIYQGILARYAGQTICLPAGVSASSWYRERRQEADIAFALTEGAMNQVMECLVALGKEAVGPLSSVLGDQLLAPYATSMLSRIGGPEAETALAASRNGRTRRPRRRGMRGRTAKGYEG